MAIQIDKDVCESTGACAMVCPEDVLEFEASEISIIDPRACTNCWICVDNCVSGAIELD